MFNRYMFRLLILSSVLNTFKFGLSSATKMALKDLDFEVFGRVQGVFFRKFTKEQADKLGIRGWCMNTSQGTVKGHLQGPNDKVENIKKWLRTTGSPSSEIEKAEFINEKEIEEFTFDNFSIRSE